MPKKPSDRGDSQTDECIGRDESGHQRKQNEQGALTCYRAQTEGQVRALEETKRAGHSPPVEHRGRDKSGHRKKPSEQGALTHYRAQREKEVRTKKETGRGALTLCHE